LPRTVLTRPAATASAAKLRRQAARDNPHTVLSANLHSFFLRLETVGLNAFADNGSSSGAKAGSRYEMKIRIYDGYCDYNKNSNLPIIHYYTIMLRFVQAFLQIFGIVPKALQVNPL